MNMKHLIAAAVAPLAVVAMPADAAVYVFNLTGAYDAAFRIDSALLSPPTEAGDDYFVVENVAGMFGGIARTASSITFNTDAFDGGFTFELGTEFPNFFGSQLFAGTTSAPSFLTGSFDLALDGDSGSIATLSIVEATAAVPEPATWMMMIAGFGAVGYAMRRRRVGWASVRAA